MKHFVSHWELLAGTKNVWRGVNSLGTNHVTVVKDIGCWTLDIDYTNGKSHVSSHNTRDEAMRYAEYLSSWAVEFA